MSAEVMQPNLPANYQELFTDRDAQVHEDLARTSLEQFTQQMEMAPVRTINFDKDHKISLVDIRSDKESNSAEAIIIPLPFGNGYSPAMYIRALTIQSLLNQPKRILMFPNNDTKNAWHKMPSEETLAQQITEENNPLSFSTGQMLAETIIRATDRMGVGQADIAGYSQGATLGADLLVRATNYLDITSAMLGDPANIQPRSAKQLQKDFQGNGFEALNALNQAINDSAIPALTEAQYSGPGFIARAKQLGALTRFGISSKSSINKELHLNMTAGDFVDNISIAERRDNLPDPRHILIARMATSLVCTPQLDSRLEQSGLSEYLEVIEGYGHEGGDNVILHALMARKAIEGYSRTN